MKKLVIAIAIGAMAVTGCVSVEGTRAKLNSGNPAEVTKAEENIFAIATTGQNGIMVLPSEERVKYISLTTNQTLLTRIFAKKYQDREIAIAIAKNMNFSKKDSLVSFLRENKERFEEISGFHGDRVKSELIKSILATATQVEMLKTCLYVQKERLFIDLDEPLALKLSEIATDERLLSLLVGRGLGTDRCRDIAVSKLTDQKILMSLFCGRLSSKMREKVLAKLTDDTICDFLLNDSRLKEIAQHTEYVYDLARRVQSNEKMWCKILNEKTDAEGIGFLFWRIDGRPSQESLANICVNARNADIIKKAVWDLKDYPEIASVLMSNKITDEKLLDRLVDRIENGAAEYELYNAVKNPTAKKAILAKVSSECRAKIREASRSACEKLIAAANGKSAETFELGGFHLGMKIEDAEMLIGYHFPDIVVHESEVDGFRILSVRGQFSPLCYAKKNGEVFQLNFGKKMLKKWYKFDVQGYDEWANAYSQKEKVSMRFKRISKTATVRGNDGTSCNVSFEQETYQYKHNVKNYRLTYYGQDKDPVLEGLFSLAEGTSEAQLIKMLAAKEFLHVRSDPGTLRIAFEED